MLRRESSRRRPAGHMVTAKQSNKSLQHAVRRVLEMSASHSSSMTLNEVISQATRELNNRAARDSNFAEVTEEAVGAAHDDHVKAAETSRAPTAGRRRSSTNGSGGKRKAKARGHRRKSRHRAAAKGGAEAAAPGALAMAQLDTYHAEQMLGVHFGPTAFSLVGDADKEFARTMLRAWAATAYDLRAGRYKCERELEKSITMMEDEKRLEALSPSGRIFSLTLRAWLQFVKMARTARARTIIDANNRAMAAVKTLRAHRSVGINDWSTAGLGYLQTPLPRSNRTRFP